MSAVDKQLILRALESSNGRKPERRPDRDGCPSSRDGVRVPFVRLSGRWLEAFGFKEGAKFIAVGVEGGLLVLTVYEAAPNVGVSRPDTSRALDSENDSLPTRNLA